MPHLAKRLKIKLEIPTASGLKEFDHIYCFPTEPEMKNAATTLLNRFSREFTENQTGFDLEKLDVTYSKNGRTKRFNVQSQKWEDVVYDENERRLGAFVVPGVSSCSVL